MDEFLKSLITQAPNLLAFILFTYWMMKRIEVRDALLFDLLIRCYGLTEAERAEPDRVDQK